MKARVLASVVAGVALAGCALDGRAPAPIPNAFVGQWLEVAGAGRDSDRLHAAARGGFLALGGDLVVIDCAGLPRASARPREIALESGVGGGRITLDDGTRLYLSLGRGWAESAAAGEAALASAEYLDVDAYRLDRDGAEQPLGRARLWSETAVRLAAAAPARTDAVSDDDRAFIAAAGDARWPAATRAAEELIRRAGSGAGRHELGHARDEALARLRGDILADLAGARADSGERATLVARARQRQLALAAWRAACARWWEARG